MSSSPINQPAASRTSSSPDPAPLNAYEDVAETTNPTPRKRKRKNSSPCWDDFVEIVRPDKVRRWQCKHCKHDFAQNSSGTTSHLRTHLKNYCTAKRRSEQGQRTLENYCIAGRRSEQGQRTLEMSCVEHPAMLLTNGGGDALKVREALAHWVMMHDHPFTICEEEGFVLLMKSMNPGFTEIGWETLRDDCMEIFGSERSKLKARLKTIDTISLTTGLWRSENQRIEYVEVTGHFVDEHWNLEKRILGFVHVPSPRSGMDIADAMSKCLKEWGIENKIFTITGDNATYSDVCFRILKGDLPGSRKSVCGGKFLQVRSCALILNLLVQDGISVISSIIENVRESVKFVSHSEARLKAFSAIVQELQLGQKKLILDVPSRWNSTYLMLITALKFKDAFPILKESEPNYDCMPDPGDWDKVGKICKLLEVFDAVTNLISTSDYPTSNLYLVEVYRIKKVIDELLVDDDVSIREMARKMKDKFENYWGECNLLIAVASIMDPRLKLGAMEYCYPQIYPEEESKRYIQNVKNALKEIFDKYVSVHHANNACNSLGGEGGALDESRDTSTSSGWSDVFSFVRSKERIPAFKSELEMYLEEHVFICNGTVDQCFSALDWWKDNRFKYPILSRMAADILAVPISTVASESVFSDGVRVIDPYRASLDPTTLEGLICGGDWIRKVHGIKKRKQSEDDIKEREIILPDP